MRILGIDPGSVVAGFGVIEHVRGVLSLVEQGTIRMKRDAELPDRLVQLHEELQAVIGRTRPQVVAVESPFHGMNSKSLIQLSHARGVILLAARAAGLEVFEYSPRSVKSAVVGYGGAEKEQVGKMVSVLLPKLREVKMAADASDALAIAICHAHSHRMSVQAVIR
jgi:crossover junction endodeoxyribonuclease RuvC